jgi:hypothetical protein
MITLYSTLSLAMCALCVNQYSNPVKPVTDNRVAQSFNEIYHNMYTSSSKTIYTHFIQ